MTSHIKQEYASRDASFKSILLIELASSAGKAVFSEKPIALDLAETQRVVQTVKKQNVPVQLGFMRRFDPGYAKAMVEAGELGKLETFRALSRDTYPPSYEFLLGSGGLFLDMSVHDLDLALSSWWESHSKGGNRDKRSWSRECRTWGQHVAGFGRYCRASDRV